ncbi:MAG: TetR family transcriptional regulator [Actinomycetota bacterium]
MSSIRETQPVDDRSTRARIRDAAIQCIADHGVTATTARKVADVADVSPGSVIHHFGSMDGLRAACDEYVLEIVRKQKQDILSSGPNLDVFAALRNVEAGPLMAYLAQVLADDSAAVASLVDHFVDDAEGYLAQGVESGMLKPSRDPRGRAVMLTIWGLGSLALHEHAKRLLGVDLMDPDLTTSPNLAAYAGPVYEIYGKGLFTDDFAEHTRNVFAPTDNTDQTDEPEEAT